MMNSEKSISSKEQLSRRAWTARICAASFLITVGLLLFWIRDQQKRTSENSATTQTRTTLSADHASDAPLLRTSSSRSTQRTAPEGIVTTHQPEQLKDFFLIECSGHKVSIHKALKLLDEAYRDACFFSLEKPLEIKYLVEGNSDKLISFSIKGKKWTSALEYIAALAGMEVNHEGLEVRLAPIEVGDRKKSVVKIPESLRETLLQELIDRGDWDTHAEKPDITTLLRLHGLIANARITDSVPSGFFMIKGTNLDTAALAALVRMEEEQPKMYVHSQIITSPSALELPLGTLTQEAALQWVQDIMQPNGTQLISAPGATTVSGKTSVNEIKEGEGNDWTGMQITSTTQPVGLKLTSEVLTEIRPIDQTRENQRSVAQIVVYDGDTQINAIGHDAGGYYYQMTSLKNVPQMGREEFARETVGQIEQPVATSVPGKPGFVFSPYTNQIIDVIDIPQGTLVADPNFPAQEKKFFRVP
jgi:hypothetical protein